ncbi:MAG: biotin--[acetyl-CoA-carboxylase] ligase [Lachnospiraceae bacterium]|nr:biotin--[acetyl-CoA-carboxylase] ligase [Lachnospiraceae bacterium]MDY4069015.1 biotin--[acetyl-CoA-carboxylase] ligase [Lachnospiraceae bacterium]
MKTEILTLLRERSDYVSGQDLCLRFGVSRTAVWKVIGQLKEEGYEIESVPRKGYRLLQTPDILSESELVSRMDTVWAGRNVHYLPETDSTNQQAKRLAEDGAPHGTLVVADMQTAGKGRRGRSWQQKPGEAIAMSIILRPDFAPEYASMLTLAAADSVAKGIEKVTGMSPMIKWPNDVIVNRRKVCGILTEMGMNLEDGSIDYVVVGIGINVNQTEFPEEIRQIATSLRLEGGSGIQRSGLIAEVMRIFERDYELLAEHKCLSGILEEYNARLINKDAAVKVLDPKGEFTGISLGINERGELLVKKEDGTVTEVYAGEVSVRGFYGYV